MASVSAQFQANLRRKQQPALNNMLWKTTRFIGYFNCLFCSVMLSTLALFSLSFFVPKLQYVQLDTPKEWFDIFTFAMNVVMCLVSGYNNIKISSSKENLNTGIVIRWIVSHFVIYQYYVLYDYFHYGFVGASYGSELFGLTFVLILASQILILVKVFEVMRR